MRTHNVLHTHKQTFGRVHTHTQTNTSTDTDQLRACTQKTHTNTHTHKHRQGTAPRGTYSSLLAAPTAEPAPSSLATLIFISAQCSRATDAVCSSVIVRLSRSAIACRRSCSAPTMLSARRDGGRSVRPSPHRHLAATRVRPTTYRQCTQMSSRRRHACRRSMRAPSPASARRKQMNSCVRNERQAVGESPAPAVQPGSACNPPQAPLPSQCRAPRRKRRSPPASRATAAAPPPQTPTSVPDMIRPCQT